MATRTQYSLALLMLFTAVCLPSCGDDTSGPAGPPETSASWIGTWTGVENLAECGQPVEGPENLTLRMCEGASLEEAILVGYTGFTCTGGFTSTTCTFDCQGTEVVNGCQRGIHITGTLTRSGHRVTGTAEFRETDIDPALSCTTPDQCTSSSDTFTRTSSGCTNAGTATTPATGALHLGPNR